MSNLCPRRSAASWRTSALPLLAAAFLLLFLAAPGFAAGPSVTVMTRNMDAGTDLNYIFAATDETSFAMGTALTLAEVKASQIPERAASLADEIKAMQPDLIALQEVSLWRTGPLMQPPATELLYDQLSLLMTELDKRGLHYSIVAMQTASDSEAPVPTEGIDLRLTDRDVILARNDLPQSEFDVFSGQSHRYRATFTFASALGKFVVPRGWMSAEVVKNGKKFYFVNTHLENAYPSITGGGEAQAAQVDELLAAVAAMQGPVVIAGDFNANAEPGPEQTGAVQRLVNAGWSDAWRVTHPSDPGFTWPLFGEDQLSGPATPNERIDLVFTRGVGPTFFGRDSGVVSAEPCGHVKPSAGPYASDHAGLVVKLQFQ